MFRRAQLTAIAALLVLIPCTAGAQANWQPTPAPAVTAENTRWYLAQEPIEWNSARYYPAGVIQYFKGNQMVRSGSYRGIPLYVDATLEPNSIVFVPLSGGRMQPYERPRTGELAGTTGSRMPSLPPGVGEERTPVDLAEPPSIDLPRTSAPVAVATTGRVARSAQTRPTATLQPPTGVNAIWVNFDGRRWFGGGKAIDYDPNLIEVGTYHGWSVYPRTDERSTIYIPVAPGRLAPYKAR